MLSNIYLHYALDLWVQQWRTRDAKGDVIIVRYADDSVIGFQYEGEAQRFLQALRERLAQFGLQLHPEKTRLIRFGRYAARNCRERGIRKPETFDFLGFTHCCGRRRNDGGFKIVRLTIKKRMRTTLAAIRETLMRRRHEPVAVVGRWLRASVTGVFELPCGARQSEKIGGFRWEVGRAWRHALMRRSQRHGCLGIVSKGCFANTCRHVVCRTRIRVLGSPSKRPIGAVCGSAARTDLAGGRWATIVPTGTQQCDELPEKPLVRLDRNRQP
uniref:reverse transcriptase domain-containing protein n=1 Tax=Rhizobium sp. T1473 TaxID=555321 RepID=UPI00403F57CA